MSSRDPMELLTDELCLLAGRFHGAGLPLVIGGGYSLYLRVLHLRRTSAKTLQPLLPVRSTVDLDLLLNAEVISSVEHTQRVRGILDELGYSPVPAAEYYQFTKNVDRGGSTFVIKVDLLAPPPGDAEGRERVRIGDRRIRPRGYRWLHAHVLEEGFSVDDHLLPVEVCSEAPVHLAHPFTMLILKLFALRDQLDEPDKGYGRHHAFDMYAILRMLTREEWSQARKLAERYSEHPTMSEGLSELKRLFGTRTSKGLLRLQEHARAVGISLDDYPPTEFARDLSDLLGGAMED